MSVSPGITSQGMPMEMHIFGKPYSVLKVFQIAHACKAAIPRLFTGKLMPYYRNAQA